MNHSLLYLSKIAMLKATICVLVWKFLQSIWNCDQLASFSIPKPISFSTQDTWILYKIFFHFPRFHPSLSQSPFNSVQVSHFPPLTLLNPLASNSKRNKSNPISTTRSHSSPNITNLPCTHDVGALDQYNVCLLLVAQSLHSQHSSQIATNMWFLLIQWSHEAKWNIQIEGIIDCF